MANVPADLQVRTGLRLMVRNMGLRGLLAGLWICSGTDSRVEANYLQGKARRQLAHWVVELKGAVLMRVQGWEVEFTEVQKAVHSRWCRFRAVSTFGQGSGPTKVSGPQNSDRQPPASLRSERSIVSQAPIGAVAVDFSSEGI